MASTDARDGTASIDADRRIFFFSGDGARERGPDDMKWTGEGRGEEVTAAREEQKKETERRPITSHIHTQQHNMAGLNLSEESKERFTKIFETAQTITHYGWLPFVIYLGWASTSNKPNIVALLSPLPSA